MDGKSILEDFDHRIAYEIRLNQAIKQNLLCPSPLMYPFEGFALEDQRRVLMLFYTLSDVESSLPLEDFFNRLSTEASPVMMEMIQLLELCLEAVDHIPKTLGLPDIPLELHENYSTTQVLSAFGINTVDKLMPFREGVKYIADYGVDVFFITLKKSEKHFSETTLYEDYAIDSQLFHWQSQSRTTLASPTGQRYIGQRTNGSKVMLFVREERSDENGKTEVYTCLGLADYISHQGSAPISIIYKLREKMPVKLMRVSNRFVGMG